MTSSSTPLAGLFLVVIDDSQEAEIALRFACRLAQIGEARVALLRIIEPETFEHWLAVAERAREEAIVEAEALLMRKAEVVQQLTGKMPLVFVREGHKRKALIDLLQETEAVRGLVLATALGDNPGPLVSAVHHITAEAGTPVTLVPGSLSDQAVDLCVLGKVSAEAQTAAAPQDRDDPHAA